MLQQGDGMSLKAQNLFSWDIPALTGRGASLTLAEQNAVIFESLSCGLFKSGYEGIYSQRLFVGLIDIDDDFALVHHHEPVPARQSDLHVMCDHHGGHPLLVNNHLT